MTGKTPAPSQPAPRPKTVTIEWTERAEFPLPPSNLRETDGEPLESNWHRDAINFLIEVIRFLFLGRTDYFVGGNMFIYFSERQVRTEDYKGPDVFFVKGVDGKRDRLYYAIWDEGGRYPNLIIELSSPSTAEIDRTEKKDLYEQTFRTPEYFIYDPFTQKLEGWRLDAQQHYQPLTPDERGWIWSEELGAWLGTWRGSYNGSNEQVWLRLFTAEGELVPLWYENERENARKEKERAKKEKERAKKSAEAAKKEKERAEKSAEAARKEKERAENAETELARLKAFLAEKGLAPPEK